MVSSARIHRDPDFAELDLPDACLLCQGPLSVRLSAKGAWAVCPSCRWLVRQEVGSANEGELQLAYALDARA